jgi:hypothetical protein
MVTSNFEIWKSSGRKLSNKKWSNTFLVKIFKWTKQQKFLCPLRHTRQYFIFQLYFLFLHGNRLV